MGLGFELAQSGSANQFANALGDSKPLEQVAPATFEGVARGVGMGVMKGGAAAARFVSMAGSVLPIAADKLLGGTKQQEEYFATHDRIFNRATEFWTPRPDEVGAAGRILGGVAEMALPLMAGGGNPTLLMGSAGLGAAEDLVREGVDPARARGVGMVQAAAVGAGFKLPFLGRNLMERVAFGAGSNVAVGAGAAAASGQILRQGGFTEQAKQFDPFDTEARAIDVLMGAVFGGIAHVATPKGRQAVRIEESPPPADGFVRYYHGGNPEGVTGNLWFTSDLRDAQGWAERDPSMKIWYTDVPASHVVRGGDPEFGVLPPARIELPGEFADQRRLLIRAQGEPLAAALDNLPESGRDALLTANNARHADVSTAPGRPRTLDAQNEHTDALAQAMDELDAGVPVTARVDVAAFEADPQQAVFRAEIENVLTAYHGSPHEFDRFDMSKIGTGEGAQAFGHGLYFAENQGVAADYQKKLGAKRSFTDQLKEAYAPGTVLPSGDKVVSLNNPDQLARWSVTVETPNGELVTHSKTPEIDMRGKTGALYRVEIPRSVTDRMLDWDKPLSEQPESVKKALQDAGLYSETAGDPARPVPRTGAMLAMDVAADANGLNHKMGAEKLRAIGIPGIRYLDQGSRTAGEGTRNFVLFDAEHARIVERNGQPVGEPASVPVAKPEVAPLTFEQRLADPDMRAELTAMGHEAGWAETGGKLLRDPVTNEVSGRTQWLAHAEWWPGRPDGLNERKVRAAVDKALAGEPLKAAERRTIEYMMDYTAERRRSEEFQATHDELAAEDLTPADSFDASLVARAMEIDPARLEQIDAQYGHDDVSFMRAVKELLDGHATDPNAAPARSSAAGATAQAGTEAVSPFDAEFKAAAEAARLNPDLPVTHEDGTVTSAADALKRADDVIVQAEQDSRAFDAAIACELSQ